MTKKNNEQYQNSEYWEERIANETWKTYNNAEEQNLDLLKMYDKTAAAIKKELYALAEAAEEQGGLTRTQQYRFSKLLGQQGEIYKEIEKLGERIEKAQSSRIKEAGKEVYSNIMESLGINDYSMPNKNEMEQMLRSPWHGSFFSKSLWEKMGKLESNLNGIINDGIATGKTVTEMAALLSGIMNKSFNDAHRLVRTETINYMNRSALRSYKDAGVKEVQWWAAEDERTCDICGNHHGDKYNIDKAPILPCHPGCRCTWIPVIESIGLSHDEKGAITRYISPDSYKLNEKLRNGLILSKLEKTWVKHLDKALEKMPKFEGTVQRSVEFLDEETKQSFLSDYVIGNKVKSKQYLSSSFNKVYNEKGNVQMMIFSKNGRDIRKLNPDEQEILFKRNMVFMVLDVNEVGGCIYIYLMEVTDDE